MEDSIMITSKVDSHIVIFGFQLFELIQLLYCKHHSSLLFNIQF